jgi:hypothetical protein
MFYAVYRVSDGELVSVGSVLAPDDVLQAKGLAYKPIGEALPPATRAWNKAILDYETVPARKAVLNKADFIDLFTDAEWDALVGYSTGNQGTVAQRRRVGSIVERIRMLGDIDLNSPRTQAALTYLGTVPSPPITAARAVEIIG